MSTWDAVPPGGFVLPRFALWWDSAAFRAGWALRRATAWMPGRRRERDPGGGGLDFLLLQNQVFLLRVAVFGAVIDRCTGLGMRVPAWEELEVISADEVLRGDGRWLVTVGWRGDPEFRASVWVPGEEAVGIEAAIVAAPSGESSHG